MQAHQSHCSLLKKHAPSTSRHSARRRSNRHRHTPLHLVHANPTSERQVFQLYPTPGETSISDVKDAHEVCSIVGTPEEKKACYAVFGLDGERVEKYYSTVVLLEGSYSKEESEMPPDTTPSLVKVFTIAVHAAAVLIALMIAILTALTSMLVTTVTEKREEAALHK